MFQIHVRLLGENKVIGVEKNWSVLQLKEHLAVVSGKKCEDLRIIFAGSVLSDSLTIEQCDLGQQSVIHVLATTCQNGVQNNQTASTPIFDPTINRIQNVPDKRRRSRFYVYCKSICCKAQPGKLRVRCSSCKDGAFTLSRGPEGWHDLERGQIRGNCNECNCDLAEFFFKCAGHEPFGDSRDEATPLSHVMSNSLDCPCLACLEIQDPVLSFRCNDRHSICLPCFAIFCQSKIRDRQMILVEQPKHIGYTLCCPGGGDDCNTAYIEEIHHFRLAGNDLYEQYQRFATEDLVIQSGGILCPGRGCGSGIFPEHGLRRIVCEKRVGGCGLIFCRDCLEEYHSGDCRQHLPEEQPVTTDYTAFVENAVKARQETAKSMKKIRETTKPCPGCNAATEKAGGCNHMTCQRCRLEWCWNCEIEWNSNCQGDHWFRLL